MSPPLAPRCGRELLRNATDKAGELTVLVMSHFTVASSEEKLAMMVRAARVGTERSTRVVVEEVAGSPHCPHQVRYGAFEQEARDRGAAMEQRRSAAIARSRVDRGPAVEQQRERVWVGTQHQGRQAVAQGGERLRRSLRQQLADAVDQLRPSPASSALAASARSPHHLRASTTRGEPFRRVVGARRSDSFAE